MSNGFILYLEIVARVSDRSEIQAEHEWTICGDDLYRRGHRVGTIVSQVWQVGKPLQVRYRPIARAVAA